MNQFHLTNPFRPGAPAKEYRIGFVLVRLLAGLDFLFHGLAILLTSGGADALAQTTVSDLAPSRIPYDLVYDVAYAVPFVATLIGVLLLAGVLTRTTLVLAYFLLLVLFFPVALDKQWRIATDLFIYAVVLAFLLLLRDRLNLTWPQLLRLRTPKP